LMDSGGISSNKAPGVARRLTHRVTATIFRAPIL
jgi:hypothetical protein